MSSSFSGLHALVTLVSFGVIWIAERCDHYAIAISIFGLISWWWWYCLMPAENLDSVKQSNKQQQQQQQKSHTDRMT